MGLTALIIALAMWVTCPEVEESLDFLCWWVFLVPWSHAGFGRFWMLSDVFEEQQEQWASVRPQHISSGFWADRGGKNENLQSFKSKWKLWF